mmetsp:Transcript_28791/g.59016  ORF Transcript_28791/g.59016 Transcript_28791/m.59016 type:complete len:257 (+) Transcript_28791:274-1044(+)
MQRKTLPPARASAHLPPIHLLVFPSPRLRINGRHSLSRTSQSLHHLAAPTFSLQPSAPTFSLQPPAPPLPAPQFLPCTASRSFLSWRCCSSMRTFSDWAFLMSLASRKLRSARLRESEGRVLRGALIATFSVVRMSQYRTLSKSQKPTHEPSTLLIAWPSSSGLAGSYFSMTPSNQSEGTFFLFSAPNCSRQRILFFSSQKLCVPIVSCTISPQKTLHHLSGGKSKLMDPPSLKVTMRTPLFVMNILLYPKPTLKV